MAKVLVVAEVKAGNVKKSAFELLTFAKSQGLEAEAVLIGSGVKDQADALAGYGATKVYVADDASLEVVN